MKVLLIRHGMTEGNHSKKYIGVTDEPLCEEGIGELKAIRSQAAGAYSASIVFVSPMLRCRQTAQILFGESLEKAEAIVIPKLREMNFGAFEGRAFAGDLEQDPQYRKWLDTNCEGEVPGGECKQDFTKRCIDGFCRAMEIAAERSASEPIGNAAFVVHGGTIMSILSGLGENPGDYYSYYTENGHGYAGEWNGSRITDIKKI